MNKNFSDAIKDVIGDEPIFDQFDIDYAASFYGTTFDSYVTGTLLNVSYTQNEKILSMSIGNRGRKFSKFYSSNVATKNTATENIIDKHINFSVSNISTPVYEKTNNDYRIFQCIDETERFYDSCLPSIETCLTADGANFWVISGSINDEKMMSPTANTEVFEIGYMFFNAPKKSIKIDSVTSNINILSNDTWTWSYPFEGRYEPEKRFTTINEVLSYATNISTEWSSADPFENVKTLPKKKKIKNFFPLLAGINSRNNLAVDGTNGLRYNKLMSSGSTYDDYFGFSYVVPSDIKLNATKGSPATFLTGTMNKNDMIKFLFGFGDVNNVSFQKEVLKTSRRSTIYTQSFWYSGIVAGASPNTLTSITATSASISWAIQPSLNGWRMQIRNNEEVYGPPLNSKVMDVSGSIFWDEPNTANNDWLLLSDTDPVYGGKLPYLGGDIANSSVTYLEVTSSHAWQLGFERAVASNQGSSLHTYFTNPNVSVQPTETIDRVYGIDTTSQKSGVYLTEFTSSIYRPGKYRINFAFEKKRTAANDSYLSPVDRAAIDKIRIYQWNADLGQDTFALTSSTYFGANNYPAFHRYDTNAKADAALSPAPINGDIGSAQYYSSFNFGVSPIIRGWKYGIYNGLPSHTKCIFRRNRYGQFRDMLEQRQYSKFISFNENIFENPATSIISVSTKENRNVINSGPVEVNFVRQKFEVNERGIGKIYIEKINPELTTSQNLSTEVTSSYPYFDGIAKNRIESLYNADLTTGKVSVDSFGNITVS